jgi:hypothetical protein
MTRLSSLSAAMPSDTAVVATNRRTAARSSVNGRTGPLVRSGSGDRRIPPSNTSGAT